MFFAELNIYFCLVTNITFRTPVGGKCHKVLKCHSVRDSRAKRNIFACIFRSIFKVFYWYICALLAHISPTSHKLSQRSCFTATFSTIYVSCLCHREKEIIDLDIKRKHVNCWKGYQLHERTLLHAQICHLMVVLQQKKKNTFQNRSDLY